MRNIIGNKGFTSYYLLDEGLEVNQDATFNGNVYGADSYGWIDILGPVDPLATGPTIPVLTSLSAPHTNFKFPLFAIGDMWYFQAHIPHGIDASTGIYLHAHVFVDGTQTHNIKFECEYTYAHGYSRAVLSTPDTVNIEQAATGIPKTHQIIEAANPILVDQFETDGLLSVIFKRLTNGGTDVTDNVFVLYVDAHARLLKHTSTNKNYPFE